MTRQKWFLVITAVAFVGWLTWLGYAMIFHRWISPPDIVSRSQLVEAQYVAVVEVMFDGDKPNPTAKVKQKLDGDGPGADATIVVTNLPKATTPFNQPLPGPGEYLVALVPDGLADPQTGPYKIAGWPRGLGEATVQPGVELKDADGQPFTPPKSIRPPLAYPWTDAVKKQMRSLGYTF